MAHARSRVRIPLSLLYNFAFLVGLEGLTSELYPAVTHVDSSKRGIKPGLTIKLELPADGVTGKRSCAAEQPASSDNQEC